MYKVEKLTKDHIEPLVIGGCILGGGGGGSRQSGQQLAELAFELGEPEIRQIDTFSDNDIILTVSGVGAPAAKNQYLKPTDYMQAVDMIVDSMPSKPVALMTNENGGAATVNGLLQSAIMGIPVVDAACNGRAHPTGIMGSMGLPFLQDYESIQAGVGGKKGTNYRVEVLTKGHLDTCSKLIRQGAVQAGGVVAVARNPVNVQYVKENGALNAISHAIEVGTANLSGKTPFEKVENSLKVLGGEVFAKGSVENFELKTIDGFDVGFLHIKTADAKFSLTFWNEYMTVTGEDGTRFSTFPDLIMTFSAETGLPVTSAELVENQEVFIGTAPYENLRLGRGMYIEENYDIIEQVLDIELKPYLTKLFQ